MRQRQAWRSRRPRRAGARRGRRRLAPGPSPSRAGAVAVSRRGRRRLAPGPSPSRAGAVAVSRRGRRRFAPGRPERFMRSPPFRLESA